jgi:hypothetical protein
MALIGANLAEAGVGFAKRFFGNASIKGRIGRSAMYFTGGTIASKYIEAKADEARNYYGDERYTSRFGSGKETLSNSAFGLGAWFAIGGLTGRDPIVRMMNSSKLYSAKASNFMTRMGARRDVRRNSRVSDRLHRRADSIRGREDHHTLVYQDHMQPGKKRYRDRNKKTTPILSRSRYVNEDALQRRIDSRSVTPRAERYSPDDIKNLSKVPRVGPLQVLSWSTMAGIGAQGTSSYISQGTVTAPVAVAGGFAAGFAATNMISKFGVGRSALGAGIIGTAGYAGYLAGERNNNPAAEGTIQMFERHNESGVRRMNYSTAGLVQALHNNNRKF